MLKRTRWEITYAILKALRNGECSKTRVMHQAYLDWRNFNRHVKFLMEKGLVTEKNGGRLAMTEKGEKILKIIEELLRILSD